ncbi:MAG: SpoIIE family protein phosphatase [Bacteroidales bacterium]|nr:SpoIIE family protein phosphatase [Bacteroidales bacterium]
MIFVILTLIITSITVFNIVYESKKQKLYDLKERTLILKSYFYKDNLLIDDFFVQDLVSYDFYKYSQSKNIVEHDSLFQVITDEINNIAFQIEILDVDSVYNDYYEKQLSDYQLVLDTLLKLSLDRGYHDFGYVGEMRFYAHELESFDDFDMSKILMLRRHEKDYIIRGQQKYVDLFESKNLLYQNLIYESNLPKHRKDSIINELELYLENFKKVVYLDSVLGIKTNSGLTKQLRDQRQSLQSDIDYLVDEVGNYIRKSEKKLKFIYVFLSGFLIIMSFSIGLIFIRYLTRPISNLSKNIKLFVGSDFKRFENFGYRTRISELVILIENYFSMKKEISTLLNDFQRKVEERTEEIQAQKETIEKQKLKVEKINKDMVSSIKYAKKIQEAILHNETILNNNFGEYFVIYKPRDIVGGDFLWFRNIKNEHFNIRLLVVADCTGHGVPGALMSMLSIAYLNEIVLRKEIIHANEVLETLRHNIINSFQHDGLDLAFIIIHDDKKIIEFAGANRSLYIKRNDVIIRVKGNKMPIGKYPTNDLFENNFFNFESGDFLFSFTDGIIDQLNEEGHKYGTKNFISFVSKIIDFKDAKASILENYYNWKKSAEQTDDILVFGAIL